MSTYYTRRKGDYLYDIDCGEAAPPGNAGRFFAQVVNMVRLDSGQPVLVSARFKTESGATLDAAVANIEAAVEAWMQNQPRSDIVAETLLSSPTANDVRAEAVKAFYFSVDENELATRLKALPILGGVRATLLDWKRRDTTGKRSIGVPTREGLPFSKRHALAIHRATFVGQLLAWCAIPAAALYALGWGRSWIRRGFSQPSG